MRLVVRSAWGLLVAAAAVASCREAPETEAPVVTQAPVADAPPVDAPASDGADEPAPGSAIAIPEGWKEVTAKIAAAAEGDTTGWERLATIADTFGHRLSGSQALEDTIDWTLEVMRSDGLENVRREKVMVPRWVRGAERARVIGGRELNLLGLGGTVGTGKRPLRAEVVVVNELEEIAALGAAAKGTIVVINKAMPPFDAAEHNTFYGETVQIRSRGAIEAAKVGAKAVLIRSVTAKSLATPHTGAMHYADDVPKIPAAALSIEDTEHLARLAAKGPVKVELLLSGKTLPDAESGNAIAEYRGRERPDEIVVIGGHIDSWDVGDGSSDDASGCVMAMEAVRLLKKAGLRPRRTIRVVLFTNEENGLRGGKAYHAAHGAEPHAGAIEADVGAGAPWGFSVTATDEAFAELEAYGGLFRVLGAGGLRRGGGGADISPLTRDGVLSVGLLPDISQYFDLHHSPADTVDKIDPANLEGNAAAMALMAYILAERDWTPAPPEAQAQAEH
ncbi:MAG: M20/M25/M40 family metallo-hydrolase [Myxococcales bacterium]|nr:M20/M25/M40 family metallo-hydrolase [Myxococcales bacterium]